MDGRLVLLKDRVRGTLATWEMDAQQLREDIDRLSREFGRDLLAYDVLAKCSRGLEEIMGRISWVSVILCVLNVADKAIRREGET